MDPLDDFQVETIKWGFYFESNIKRSFMVSLKDEEGDYFLGKAVAIWRFSFFERGNIFGRRVSLGIHGCIENIVVFALKSSCFNFYLVSLMWFKMWDVIHEEGL